MLFLDSQDCHNDAVRGHIFLRIIYGAVALNLESGPVVLDLLSASEPTEGFVKTQFAGPHPQSFRLNGSGVGTWNERLYKFPGGTDVADSMTTVSM